MIVAVVLAICVPFASLVTDSDRIECCCPDPDKCNCPDHDPAHVDQTSMRACHKSTPDAVTAQLAAYVPPAVPVAAAPEQAMPLAPHVLRTPHPAPPPPRPDAPS